MFKSIIKMLLRLGFSMVDQDILNSEFRAIQIKLEFLAQAIAELKAQNEDRRQAIDNVALSLRNEFKQTQERNYLSVANLKNEIEKLKTEIAVTRWIGLVIGGTALTLVTMKLLNGEFQSPTHSKEALAIYRGGA